MGPIAGMRTRLGCGGSSAHLRGPGLVVLRVVDLLHEGGVGRAHVPVVHVGLGAQLRYTRRGQKRGRTSYLRSVFFLVLPRVLPIHAAGRCRSRRHEKPEIAAPTAWTRASRVHALRQSSPFVPPAVASTCCTINSTLSTLAEPYLRVAEPAAALALRAVGGNGLEVRPRMLNTGSP